ncbi:MAG: hypothetical protein HFG35_11120 [Eubacterium sp.]|jgi:hypothetical protein|nr:hypothetical protein [Eubacterium sp.]
MKKQVKKVPIYFIMMLALVFICVLENEVNTQAALKGKIIMNQSKISLVPGSKFKLKVKKVKPSKLGRIVTYKSNKKKVATVSKKGVVRAKKAGKAKIVIASKKNKRIKTTVMVMVQENKKEKKKASYTVNPPMTQKPENSVVPVVTPEPPKHSPEPPKEPANDIETFDHLTGMYFDIISKEFTLMINAGTVNQIAIDLTDCISMSDSEKQILAGLISEKYGKRTVLKTMEELKAEGSIVDDPAYGFVFRGGVFIKIREMEKDSSGFSFYVSCAMNGLSLNAFTHCKAFVDKENKWSYKLDGKLLS